MASARTGATTKYNRPKDISTKEELIKYLEANKNIEPPFIEELWEECVKKADADRKIIESGGTKKGIKSANPVSHYFRLCGLKKYNRMAREIVETMHTEEILSGAKPPSPYEEDNEFANDILVWIGMFPPTEREYLRERYENYYDQYEINDGADRNLLRRILSTEIALYRIDVRRAMGQPVNLLDEKKLNDQLTSLYESMKWTKKQRNLREDMAQNKFTVWLDNMTKEGGFTIPEKHYPKDEIDFLLETYIDSAREMMT